MSCETNQNRVSTAAPSSGGINARQSKFAGAAGRTLGALTGQAGRIATRALSTVESFDGPGSLEALTGGGVVVEAGILLALLRARKPADEAEDEDIEIDFKDPDAVPGWAENFLKQRLRARSNSPADDRRYREGSRPDWEPGKNRIIEEMSKRPPRRKEEGFTAKSRTADLLTRRALMAMPLLRFGQTISRFAGTGAARLARQGRSDRIGGVEQRFFFPGTSKVPVNVWQSSLTPLFNLADSAGSRITSSEGKMFEVKGKSWHYGATVVKTRQGERTITHLQSLSIPAAHYYYSHLLSDNEVVGIITDQKGFEPKALSSGGYAGQISEVESLCPMWASLKRSLIQAHLRWGDAAPATGGLRAQAEEPAAVQAGKQDDRQGQGSRQRKRGGRLPSGGGNQILTPSGELPAEPPQGDGPRVKLGSREYRVFVRRVVEMPDQRRLAEAAYYDDRAGVWREVKDPAVRERLASDVGAGLVETWGDKNFV